MQNALLIGLLLLPAASLAQRPLPVGLSVAQAAKICDSLAVLPLVRQEAAAWHRSAAHFQSAADSLGQADVLHLRAFQAEKRALQAQAGLLREESARAAQWKHRARRRGLLNYVLLALAGGAGYAFLRP
ncbi:MAG: hypothetical protein ACRYG7_46220 [Janthinobacterium lividum]